MKRIFKTLLFVIMLFVATNVKASDDFTVQSEHLNIDTDLYAINRKTVYGTDDYVFCMDKDYRHTDMGKYGNSNNSAYSIDDVAMSKRVENVLLKAYMNGLSTGSNSYGITEDEFYAITQMAVWHAAHGTAKHGYNESKYGSWLGNGTRRDAFNELVNAESGVSFEIQLNVNSEKIKFTKEDNSYISDNIAFYGSNNLRYVVRAEGNACIRYEGGCYPSVLINPKENFQLEVKDDGSKILEASIKISSSETVQSHSFNMYVPLNKDGIPYVGSNGEPNPALDEHNQYGNVTLENTGKQRVATLKPSYGRIEKEFTIKIDNNTKTPTPVNNDVKKIEVKICKSNDECEREIKESVISIYDVKDNFSMVDSCKANAGDCHKIELRIDRLYKLEEVSITNESKELVVDTYFKVNEAGQVQLCNVKENNFSNVECENVTNEHFEVNGVEIIIKNCFDSNKAPEISEPINNTEDTETTTVEAPNTGITTKSYVIGGLVMLVGAITVITAKKKENI